MTRLRNQQEQVEEGGLLEVEEAVGEEEEVGEEEVAGEEVEEEEATGEEEELVLE